MESGRLAWMRECSRSPSSGSNLHVLCSNGCGIDIGVKDGRIVGVRGREVDRINHGRLGPKGLHGWVANNSPDRLTKPLIREDGILREASWGETMDLIVRRSHEIREEYTGDAIAFYSTGQIFIEEYYTLAVIAKAGLGTSQADGNTRLYRHRRGRAPRDLRCRRPDRIVYGLRYDRLHLSCRA
ncbi:MAG: molybdopterin-dependent oxidoreductase [Methanoculleus sp.]